MIAWVRFHADPGRTIMIASKRTFVKIRNFGNEWFMIIWHAVLVGWMVCWKQGVEKTMEFASAYETNVANLNRLIRVRWTWLPQSVSVQRIFDGKLFAKDIAVGHRGSQEPRRTTQRPWGKVCDTRSSKDQMTQNPSTTISASARINHARG
jgi:hypothetical protein